MDRQLKLRNPARRKELEAEEAKRVKAVEEAASIAAAKRAEAEKRFKGPFPLPYRQLQEGGFKLAHRNEQLLRFVLLTNILSKAGLCDGDIQVCIAKYVKRLKAPDRALLELALPNLDIVLADPVKEPWKASPAGICILAHVGGPRSLPYATVITAVRLARLRFLEDPNWFYGNEDGWFIKLAQTFAQRSKQISVHPDRWVTKNAFWLGDLENALWISIMARLTLANTSDASATSSVTSYLRAQAPLYREAWLTFFNIFWDQKHHDTVCKCPNKANYALGSEEKYNRKAWPDHHDTVQNMERRIGFISEFLGEELANNSHPCTLYKSFPDDNPRPVIKAVFSRHWSEEIEAPLEGLPGQAKKTAASLRATPDPVLNPPKPKPGQYMEFASSQVGSSVHYSTEGSAGEDSDVPVFA